VIHDADGLDGDTMLCVARETRLSETTFVQSPEDEGADYRNRIWTIAGELPFAGHPSLGTAVAVARIRGERAAHYVQQTGVGLQPIDVELSDDGRRGRASMLQEPPVFGEELDRAKTIAAVGLPVDDAHPELPPQVVSTGIPNVLVPVSAPAALERAEPDDAAIAALLDGAGAVVLYLVCPGEAGEHARARGFTPLVEGGEDPATGSAAGPLCAYLAQRTGAEAVTVEQGREIGRPSRLEAAIDGDRVRVSGDVVVVVTGTIEV
jgi:trans-2,3-dihydro-3-hydroxyanthranilate isomerase